MLAVAWCRVLKSPHMMRFFVLFYPQGPVKFSLTSKKLYSFSRWTNGRFNGDRAQVKGHRASVFKNQNAYGMYYM